VTTAADFPGEGKVRGAIVRAEPGVRDPDHDQAAQPRRSQFWKMWALCATLRLE
jgi:hypothetical protein